LSLMVKVNMSDPFVRPQGYSLTLIPASSKQGRPDISR
jgi:hypothetical protein